MALMYPELDEQKISPDSERIVYCALRDQLDEEFHVFYSLQQIHTNAHQNIRESESDFIIVHRQYGILVLEVKGGEVSYDPLNQQWYSRSLGGTNHPITDPYLQSQQNLHHLCDKIRATNLFGAQLPIPFGYGVIFPDGNIAKNHQSQHNAAQITLDWDDLSSLREKIPQLMRQWGRSQQTLSKKQLEQMITQALMPSFRLIRILPTAIKQQESHFARLTEQQLQLVSFLGNRRQALIQGVAGTGKTILAYHKALELATKGYETLVVCFNILLARRLQLQAQNLHSPLHVFHYHGLVSEFAERAGIPFHVPTTSQDEVVFWNETTPVILVEAATSLGITFDAIIVDEGQDFLADWWDSLKILLRDPVQSFFYVFFDPSQNIYRPEISLPFTDPPFALSLNCRSTQTIHQLSCQIAQVEYHTTAGCPTGQPPQLIAYRNDQDQIEKIENIIKELTESHDIVPNQIVLLLPHRIQNSCLSEVTQLAGFPLIELQGETPIQSGHLYWATIQRYKGLEADIVMLCDIDSRDPFCSPNHLYVGTSRAKHLLYLLHHKDGKPVLHKSHQ